MNPNFETNQFELNSDDRLALAAPMFDQQVPFADASLLLKRAEARVIENDERDMSQYIGDTLKMVIRNQADTRRVLKAIIWGVEPMAAQGISSGAEAYLQDQDVEPPKL